MKTLFVVYKLIWFRVLGYFLVPFFMVVLSQTETWSGETWEQTHWFILVRIGIAATLAGLASIFAFIDQSLDKAAERHAQLQRLESTVPPQLSNEQ